MDEMGENSIIAAGPAKRCNCLKWDMNVTKAEVRRPPPALFSPFYN
jgi:hypothetical protein